MVSRSGRAWKIFFLQCLERSPGAFIHLFSPSTKGGGTLQQHLTLLGHTGGLSSAASDVAAASPSAAAFQGWQQTPLHHPSPQPEEGGAEQEAAFVASSMNFQLPARLATA